VTTTAVTRTPQDVLGSYPTYAEAQHVVDALADQDFPVQRIRIVGHGITTVETVTGRMTKGRAALAGAGSGAWFGLLIGVILGLFLPGPVWVSIVVTSLVLGALWGAGLGFVAHWSTRGRRDFSSTQSLAAERYDVMVDTVWVGEARRVLQTCR
jgi:hypothetical protein